MQKNNIIHYYCLFSLFCLPLFLFGQVIRENAAGEKIIVYPDGRMEYFNGEPVEPSADNGQEVYPVFKGYIEPLEGSIQINEADLFKIAQRRSQLSVTAAELSLERVKQAEDNLSRLQSQLRSTSDENLRNILQKQLAAAQRSLDQSRRQATESQQAASQDDELVRKGGYIEAFNERRRQRQSNEAQSRDIRAAADQSYAQLIPLSDNTIASNYEDLMLNPPKRACQVAFAGQDEERNLYRRDLESELLFSYTDERLRPYLQGKEYLTCEAYMSSVGGYRYLTLDFTFAYPNAQEAYGFIDRNSMLSIKLMNGDFINLRAGQMDRGKYDTIKQELSYSVFYPIDRSFIGLLKDSEIDLLRVFWSSGFEEYPIYQMDFFKRQLRCLGD
jgi:hypothetical protein